jgi:hypothetical protein
MRSSWQQFEDQEEAEFLERLETMGEIESRNNLNGGVSRMLGFGDGRPGAEWTGLRLEVDSAVQHRYGDWPLWRWVVLSLVLAIGLVGLWLQNGGSNQSAVAADSGNAQAQPVSSAEQTP